MGCVGGMGTIPQSSQEFIHACKTVGGFWDIRLGSKMLEVLQHCTRAEAEERNSCIPYLSGASSLRCLQVPVPGVPSSPVTWQEGPWPPCPPWGKSPPPRWDEGEEFLSWFMTERLLILGMVPYRRSG